MLCSAFVFLVLIETLWNVKVYTLSAYALLSCINRNIVECKEQIVDFVLNLFIRINRNIVECKVRYRSASPLAFPVLIETLWNVKIQRNTDFGRRSGINRNIVECKVTFYRNFVLFSVVLIETLWNVKKTMVASSTKIVGCINRNIVECKVLYLLPYKSFPKQY